ncbi:MAG: glycosyltransferase, partial [Proteobacteria bacterium]|nr:glycosyltransferase [Pseudomonadota bacterium]
MKNGAKNQNETKTLVLIVAYEAESHITSVLNRLPGEIWNNSAFEILCIDDASHDSTAEFATKWRSENQIKNIVVLKNRNNQGYGGNQKLGYKYAMDHEFDYVVLLHGDGQYAPELVAEIAKTMAEEKSDVYLGARTWSYWNARSGGMPRYKYFGNKIQAFYNEAKIIERPIPVHYGDEVCRVNGPVYAVQVFLATLHYALINFGILNSPQYRRKQVDRYIDKAASPWSSHGQAISMLAKYPTKTILDIGCGNGSVARRMMQAGNVVHGMDRADYRHAAPWSGFNQIDLDRDAITLDTSSFDAIVCLDVLEHLKRPEELLLSIREAQKSDKAPLVLLCTPNIAFITVRLALLLGFFNYSDKGILDIDHSRLFSRQSFLRMIRNSGYDVLEFAGVPAPWDFA